MNCCCFLGHLKPPSSVRIVDTLWFTEYRDVMITWKFSEAIDRVYMEVIPDNYLHIEQNLTHAVLGLPYGDKYKVQVAAGSCGKRGESYTFLIGKDPILNSLY